MSSDSVPTATEKASRLDYKHDLHVASRDYQEVIQHTHIHPHIHSLTESFFVLFVFSSRSTPTSLST